MAIGGFNGTDPTPTLAQFEQYVRDGQDPLLHRRRLGGGSAVAVARSRRRQHVEHVDGHHHVGHRQLHRQTVGGVTVYDLTSSST